MDGDYDSDPWLYIHREEVAALRREVARLNAELAKRDRPQEGQEE